MSVDRLLELLKQFKDLTNKRERVWPARCCTTVDIVLPCHCKQPDVEVAFSLIPRPTPAQKRFWNFSRDFLAFSESMVLKTHVAIIELSADLPTDQYEPSYILPSTLYAGIGTGVCPSECESSAASNCQESL